MTKPIRPNYGKKGYGLPSVAPPGKVPGRGQIARTGVYRRRPIEELGIVFRPDGTVLVPHDLRRRTVVLPNPYAAVRFAHHQFRSITREADALKTVLDGVRGAHFKIETNWKSLSRAEQKEIIDYLTACLGAFGDVERLTAKFKLSAHSRLERAVSLLEDRNVGAGQASMMGMSMDLIARINESIGQRKGVQRRHLELVDEANIRGNKLGEYFSKGEDWFAWLSHPRVSLGQRSRIARQIDAVMKSMSSKIEPELASVREQLGHAKAELQRNKPEEARRLIQTAGVDVLKALVRQYLAPIPVLEKIARFPNAERRRTAFDQQFEILADNIKYWGVRSHSPGKIVQHLTAFASVARHDLSPEKIQAVQAAAQDISTGEIASASQRLLDVAGKKKRKK